MALLEELSGQEIEELWLDLDLVGEDTIWPVVHLCGEAALAGRPLDIGLVWVHAARADTAHKMIVSLRRRAYEVKRSSHPRFWLNNRG